MKPSDNQVGGDHYKKTKIDPIIYGHENNLNFCEVSIIKYVTRHRHKNKKEDLLKAKHYIDILLNLEYPEETKEPIWCNKERRLNINDLRRIVSNPDKKDGLELHLTHLWNRKEFESLYAITGIKELLSLVFSKEETKEIPTDSISQTCDTLQSIINEEGADAENLGYPKRKYTKREVPKPVEEVKIRRRIP